MVSVTTCCDTETTLTLSETSFTTHASSLLKGFTETGSMPTGISAMRIGFCGFETSKTESRLSGVFTAKRREPSGERRTGEVCLPSKFTKVCAVKDEMPRQARSSWYAKRVSLFIMDFGQSRGRCYSGSAGSVALSGGFSNDELLLD